MTITALNHTNPIICTCPCEFTSVDPCLIVQIFFWKLHVQNNNSILKTQFCSKNNMSLHKKALLDTTLN